jgi:predicted ribosomally synthesized peptide with SipW-like signal peptide
MRVAAVAVAAWCVGGCSVFFNPDNVHPTMCSQPAVTLEAVVGDGTSLTWQWPNGADAGPFKDWQLCWGASANVTDTCKTIPYGSCDPGTCGYTLGADAGLVYNKRLYGTLVAHDLCQGSTPQATASATPINGSFLDTEGITLLAGCDAGLRTDGGGTLAFDESAGLLCISTAMMGDEAWEDFTMELEVKVTGDTLGGVAFRAPSGTSSPRNGALITASPNQVATVWVTQRPSNGEDAPVATSVAAIAQNTWHTMRVSALQKQVSVEVAISGQPLREVVRWTDSTQGPTQTGPLGLVLAAALFAQGHGEFRNLRVRTGAAIPDGGPARDGWTFTGVGPSLRLVGGVLTPCPAYLPENGCSVCAPDAGSQCLEINNDAASLEVPIGVDYDKPWAVRFKFAPHLTDLTVLNPSLLRTTQPPVMRMAAETAFSGMPLIDVTGANWSTSPRMFRTDTESLGPPLTKGQWTAFEVTFDAHTLTYAVKRNGAQVRSGAYPAMLAPHLGALVLGGGGNTHGYFTDVEVVQPPE